MRRTRTLSGLLVAVAALMFLAPQMAPAQQAIRVYIDGRLAHFDVPPTISQGRVLVPLRGVFEQLGANVDYDARTQHIVAIRGTQIVELTIGSRQAMVNGAPRLLDVPAFTMGGRTMVPLRFISEALGADVQWNAASQTILIGTAGAAPTPPPYAQPAPTTEISGRLVAVTTGENPRIVLRHNGQDSTIIVTPATGIYRFNAETNVGGSAALGSLQKGDLATVTVNQRNEATKIVATYRVPPAGQIANVNRNNRTVTLSDGRAYVVLADADITFNGESADFSALQPGRTARFSVIEGTNQAYEVNVSTAAAIPPPATVSAPRITAPASGETVGRSFRIRGTAQPGAMVVVTVQPRLLGQMRQVRTTVAANGSWRVDINLDPVPFVSFPYVISAVQIFNGTQSDPASVEVNVR